jgi:hypothetical protein
VPSAPLLVEGMLGGAQTGCYLPAMSVASAGAASSPRALLNSQSLDRVTRLATPLLVNQVLNSCACAPEQHAW